MQVRRLGRRRLTIEIRPQRVAAPAVGAGAQLHAHRRAERPRQPLALTQHRIEHRHRQPVDTAFDARGRPTQLAPRDPHPAHQLAAAAERRETRLQLQLGVIVGLTADQPQDRSSPDLAPVRHLTGDPLPFRELHREAVSGVCQIQRGALPWRVECLDAEHDGERLDQSRRGLTQQSLPGFGPDLQRRVEALRRLDAVGRRGELDPQLEVLAGRVGERPHLREFALEQQLGVEHRPEDRHQLAPRRREPVDRREREACDIAVNIERRGRQIQLTRCVEEVRRRPRQLHLPTILPLSHEGGQRQPQLGRPVGGQRRLGQFELDRFDLRPDHGDPQVAQRKLQR